jgi:tRNA (guanosine-2'-O-)-methyltransferase
MAFGIGILNYLHDCNISGLMRSAYCFNAGFVFTIGKKYKRESADTVNCIEQIPYYHYLTLDDFEKNIPYGYQVICVENPPEAKKIETFCHPKKAIYLLGNEAQGLPKKVINKNWPIVKIESKMCLNVSVAGSIIMYDRQAKIAQQKLSGI